MEGTRPLLVEIQALVAPTVARHAAPRRRRLGPEPPRRWCSPCSRRIAALRLGMHDVYLNVAGGLRISEPAADLAVAAALVSSLSGSPLPPDCVYFGEIGLSGAVRPVAQAPARLKEAAKLGFASAVRRRRRRRGERRRSDGVDRRTSPISSPASPRAAAIHGAMPVAAAPGTGDAARRCGYSTRLDRLRCAAAPDFVTRCGLTTCRSRSSTSSSSASC